MAKQITVDSADEQPEENKQLVAKVDQMLNPAIAQSKSEPAGTIPEPSDVTSLPPLDIFAGTPSAPLLSTAKKKGRKKTVTTAKSTKNIHIAPTMAEPTESETLPDQDNEPEESVSWPSAVANEYNDSQTAAAIDSIVASEEDTLLNLEDQVKSSRTLNEGPKHHIFRKLFWLIVGLLCLAALSVAVHVVYPNVTNPVGKEIWHLISHRII